MSQRGRNLGLIALTGAILALTVAGAAAGFAAQRAAASTVRVVISQHGGSSTGGRFVLKGAAGSDFGTAAWHLFEGPEIRVRDGQYFYGSHGSNDLDGKKGKVTFSFVGIHVDAGGDFFVEYGTWRIVSGTGTALYRGWHGGGRWTAVLRNTRSGFTYSIDWEGLVTR